MILVLKLDYYLVDALGCFQLSFVVQKAVGSRYKRFVYAAAAAVAVAAAAGDDDDDSCASQNDDAVRSCVGKTEDTSNSGTAWNQCADDCVL